MGKIPSAVLDRERAINNINRDPPCCPEPKVAQFGPWCTSTRYGRVSRTRELNSAGVMEVLVLRYGEGASAHRPPRKSVKV